MYSKGPANSDLESVEIKVFPDCLRSTLNTVKE